MKKENFIVRFIRCVLSLMYRLVRRELTDETFENWMSFVKFLLVGASNTIILFVVYYAVILVGGSELYLVGQGIGYFAGVINSYIWNSRFVFSKGNVGAGAFVKMCLCYVLTYFVQTWLLYLQVNTLGVSEFVAPVIAVVITTVINYFLNRFFAFGIKNTEDK